MNEAAQDMFLTILHTSSATLHTLIVVNAHDAQEEKKGERNAASPRGGGHQGGQVCRPAAEVLWDILVGAKPTDQAQGGEGVEVRGVQWVEGVGGSRQALHLPALQCLQLSGMHEKNICVCVLL